MERTHFTVGAGSGQLSGWLAGRGQRVVALHGGPGMDYCYLDDAVLELATRYQVATFQQRGLAPPTESGEFTIAEALADHAAAPPMPHLQISQAAHLGLWADLQDRLPELESSLPSITIPVGVLFGERSPIPPSAGTDSAQRIPGAWAHVEPDAGHFVWHEAPGCVAAAMDRLVAGS